MTTELSRIASIYLFPLRKDSRGSRDLESKCRKALKALLICFVASASLHGCGDGYRRSSWIEDVQIDDSRTVTVERSVKYSIRGEISGTWQIESVVDASLQIQGSDGPLPPWRQALNALVLYWDDSAKQWVIVATTMECDIYFKSKAPKSPYWEFRLSDSEWNQVELSTVSLGRRRNLRLSNYEELAGKRMPAEKQSPIDTTPRWPNRYNSVLSSLTNVCGIRVVEPDSREVD